jgi:hypothetical protein
VDGNQTERAIAIAVLRDIVLRRSLADIERTIEKMVDEAIESPSSQLARDLRALGALPPEPNGFEPEGKPLRQLKSVCWRP